MSDSTFGSESRWGHFMEDVRANAAVKTPLEVRGTLTRLAGLVLEAVGLKVPVGSQCLIGNGSKAPVLAEVVGFSNDRAFLMPAGDTHGLSSGASVTPLAPYRTVPRVGQTNKPPSPDDRGTLRLPLGKAMPMHQVAGEITVQCLEGVIDFETPEGVQRLQTGQLLFLRGGVPHSLLAVEDASVLVTIVLAH
mgnify:CR=1 FL=1